MDIRQAKTYFWYFLFYKLKRDFITQAATLICLQKRLPVWLYYFVVNFKNIFICQALFLILATSMSQLLGQRTSKQEKKVNSYGTT